MNIWENTMNLRRQANIDNAEKYLYEIIDDYKHSDSDEDRDDIFKSFCSSIWSCENKRRVYTKTIRFSVRKDLLETDIGQVFDIVDSLTKFDAEKSKFGSLTELDKYGDSLSYFYENAIAIDVDKIDDTGELYIVEMWIEYDMLQSDYKYCYRGIDDTSTKEDVENILGKDNVVFLDDYCNYTDEERSETVRMYINEEGYVNNINYIKNY